MKLLIMDVDGTLTDGKIYMGPEGEAMKAFHVKDGLAIAHLLPQAGILPAIITGRESKILENRCKELQIHHLYQGISQKSQVMHSLLNELQIELHEVAYIGDDINDLSAMNYIQAAGGLVGCPADAAEQVKKIADYITQREGGNGSVREFIEWLLRKKHDS